MKHPVIFVVDNDDGGDAVRKSAEKLAGAKFDVMGEQLFFPVRDNLYLVATPPNEYGEPSAIEDCFPKEVLETKLNGKSFDSHKEHGDDSTFGKHIFAEQIVRPGVDKIDFSGFEPLLKAISEAIAHYHGKLVADAKLEKSA